MTVMEQAWNACSRPLAASASFQAARVLIDCQQEQIIGRTRASSELALLHDAFRSASMSTIHLNVEDGDVAMIESMSS